jgi:hypothetical protein
MNPCEMNHPIVHSYIPFAHIPYLLATRPLLLLLLSFVISSGYLHLAANHIPFRGLPPHIFGTSTKSLPLISYSLDSRLAILLALSARRSLPSLTRLYLARRYRTGVTSEKVPDHSNCNSILGPSLHHPTRD